MFTDIHVGARGNSEQHLEDCLRYIDWFCALAVQVKATHIAFLGDYYENRSNINVRSLDVGTEIARRLDRLGINVSDKYNEPADHLAIELDLMGSLIIRAVESTTADQREAWLGEQESLLHGHLLGWFERFEQACRAADKFGFYGASARLLGVFLKMDANYLSLVKPAPSAD
jgi:TorA-specific chaperone